MAAAAWSTSWKAFPGEWRGRLDEAWSWLRQAGIHGGCNVMHYRDLPEPHRMAVEVGVEVSGPFEPAGRVRPSALPAGLTSHGFSRSPAGDVEAGEDGAWREALLARLHRLSPAGFEEFTLYLLRTFGIELTRVGGVGDGL